MPKYSEYPAYKDSGEVWLGKIPVHWEPIRIGHLSPVKRGASPRPIEDEKYFDDDGEYVWTRISDVTASDMYLKDCPERLSDLGSSLSVKLQPGELFLSIAATVGKPCITAIKACIHDGFVYFPQLKIPNKFLYYVFVAGHAYAGLGKMGTQLNLNTDTVSRIKIALGSPEEVASTITFLDYETAKIDALIEKQQQLIALLGEKRQAVISHAVTKGLNPDAPMRDSGVEWLGEVPAHWQLPPLYCRYDQVLGKMLDQNKLTGKHTVPYVRNVDVQWDCINADGLPVIDIRPAELERFTMKNGDLMICEGGEVGRSAIWSGDDNTIAFQKAIHRLRPLNDSEHPRYLFYVMRFAADMKVFLANSNPNTIPHLTGEQLRQYRFPKPPFREQVEIAAYLDQLVFKLNTLEEKAELAIETMRERTLALISSAVTGKIDVRGWKRPSSEVEHEPEMEVA